MPKEKFTDINFRDGTIAYIEMVNDIIEEYQNAGHTLSLRQLFYRLVARGLTPNTYPSYKNLIKKVTDGRRAGLIDWDAIEDRSRWVRRNSSWNSPMDMARSAVRWYHIDLWENQEYRPEVWIEKDALVGVVINICEELDVPLFSCRGFASDSEVYAAAKRMAHYDNHYDQYPLIIHLADHDPSGIDMTRDIIERVCMYSGVSVEVERIALNMDQIELYQPPPDFTKQKDTRSTGYKEKFGDRCWELDALEPGVISDLIYNTVVRYRDYDKLQIRKEQMERERAILRKAYVYLQE